MKYPVYVINLDKHKDRWLFMSHQLDLLGIQPIRIDAINGADESKRSTFQSAWYAPLTPGEIGCFESHRFFWQQVIKSNTSAIVLEDDVAVSSDFGTLEIPTELLGKIDVLKIDQSRPKESFYGTIRHSVSSTRYAVRMLGTEISTGCYLVTPHGAKKLLDSAKNYILPVDTFMFNRASKSFWNFNVWKLCDAAASQLHMISDQSQLHEDFQDRIQGAPRPELEKTKQARIRRLRLQLRRLRDMDTRYQRDNRGQKNTKAFALNEAVDQRHINFSSPEYEHFRQSLELLRKT